MMRTTAILSNLVTLLILAAGCVTSDVQSKLVNVPAGDWFVDQELWGTAVAGIPLLVMEEVSWTPWAQIHTVFEVDRGVVATLGSGGAGVILWDVSDAAMPWVLYQDPWPFISLVRDAPPAWTVHRTDGRVVLTVVDRAHRTYRYDVTAARCLSHCQEDVRGTACGVLLKGV